MPSSMIFVGLVVMWLLILVPAVARRPAGSGATQRHRAVRAGAGAVAATRSGRGSRAGGGPRRGGGREARAGAGTRRRDEAESEDRSAGRRERPPAAVSSTAGPLDLARARRHANTGADRARSGATQDGPRYRPGRGGYDPRPPPLTARARYAFRQRVVLVLLILAVGSAVAAVVHRCDSCGGRTAGRCAAGRLPGRTCAVRCGWRKRSGAGASARVAGPPPRPGHRTTIPAVDRGRRPETPPTDLDDHRDLDEDESGMRPGSARRGRRRGSRGRGRRLVGRPIRPRRPRATSPSRWTSRRRSPAEADAAAARPDRHDVGGDDRRRPRSARAGEPGPARLPACVGAVSGCYREHRPPGGGYGAVAQLVARLVRIE